MAAGSIYLWNSIVWGNFSTTSPQTYIDPGYGGTITLQYSDIQGGYAGTGNIDADPVFSGPWCFTGEGSPCIDAGDPDAALNDLPWPSAPTAARWPSRGGLRGDIGVCGGPACYPLELAMIYNSDTLGWVPWEVSFEAESYFEADSWNWEFGDGDGAAGQAVVHTYDDPGAYDLTLTIGYGAGEVYEYTREALVYGLADTMWAGDVELAPSVPSVPVEILVQAKNYVPLGSIWITINYSGDLQLAYDGFTTVGCRTVDFDTQTQHFHNPAAKTAMFELSGNPGLSLGSGPILKLLFHTVSAEDGQSATIALTGDLFPVGPQFPVGVVYQPATIEGSVQCVQSGCCQGRVGDANAEGVYPDEVTLADIMMLVDVKFISSDCSKLPCLTEADVNQDGGADPSCEDHVTLGDIMTLVDFLFITGPDVAVLPECL